MANDQSKIIVRNPYGPSIVLDEQEIEFLASNGKFSGATTIYCHAEDLIEIGQSIQNFPRKYPDEYCYQFNQLQIKAYTPTISDCAIRFSFKGSDFKNRDAMSSFEIYPIKTQELTKLGELFVIFSKLEHKEFSWTPDGNFELVKL